MKYLATLKALALAVAVSLTLVACDEEDSNPIDADPDVQDWLRCQPRD